VIDMLPFYWAGFKVVPNYTYVLDLANSLDDILRGMSQTRRNDIVKAQRDGLSVRKISDVRVVRELVNATFRRQEKDFDASSLERVLVGYANEGNSYGLRPIAMGPHRVRLCRL